MDDILKRAEIEYVSRFILGGSEPLNVESDIDYDTMLDNAYKLFKCKLKEKINNEELEKEIVDNVSTLLDMSEEIYFKIGIQAGMKLQGNNKRI